MSSLTRIDLRIPLAIGLLCLSASAISADDARPNILLIVVDDLRDTLGCYGNQAVKTPQQFPANEAKLGWRMALTRLERREPIVLEMCGCTVAHRG